MTVPQQYSKKLIIGALALIVSLFLSPLGHALDSASDPAAETARLHTWLDKAYEEELAFTPESLTVLGRREHYDQLDDPSIEARDRRIAWYVDSVAAMEAEFDYESLDQEGRLSYDFWIYRLKRMQDTRKYRHLQLPMSQLQGLHTELPEFLINYHEVESAKDIQAYISRLGQIAPYLLTQLDEVQSAAQNGVRAPKFAYDTVIRQTRGFITGAPFDDNGDSPLWANANGKIDDLLRNGAITEREAREQRDAVRSLLLDSFGPAYAEVLSWFEGDRPLASADPRGALSMEDGNAYYAERLRYYTTTNMSAAEIHQLGLQEVARIHGEIRALMEEVNFEGDLKAFFNYIRDDESFYYPSTDEGRQAFKDETQFYLDRINKRLPEYFGVLPKAGLEVRRVEAFRERDGAAAFYQQGTPDGSRPGVYYMHLSDMGANNRSDLQTTAYHEGNPGHHMQVSIALERDDLPLFRSDVWYSGYGEGWALYAEQVAFEMGVYDNPYYNVGRLVSEVFRAIRLVVDTGIHALGWSEEQAVQYMLDNSAVPEASARSEIRRCIVWPGQATAYKIGMLKILELRRYAQTMLGDQFSIRDFHDLVLAGGSLPLEILENRVQQWVSSQQQFDATVRRGPYGVAHIKADDYASLGYGEGYAAAEDHVCNIAHALLQARGETSRYFGAGANNANVANDATVRALDISGQARVALDAQSPRIQRWIAGYTAGYNRYVAEHPGSRNDSWCSSAPWVRAVTPDDFMARMVHLALTLPRMGAAVAAAQPPGQTVAAATSNQPLLAQALDNAALQGMGSNGWAIGKDMSENGRGLLLANPHYPWYGANRFWEKHLTIPGELDVYGVVTLGAPGVAIGFNANLGWTHTVSASQRLVLYRLTLDPENPLRYRYGDTWREIEARELQVPVADGEDGIRLEPTTVYFSHYGPMLTLPNMAWDQEFAYTARDANMGNFWLLAQWMAMGQAQDLDTFIDAHRQFNAMPWVNTIAASKDGRALYLDNSTVGNLSSEAQDGWRSSLANDPLAAGLRKDRGMVLLDGSDPGNEWIDTGDTLVPGTVPFDERPAIERSDYVFNANNSYWLSSPRAPLTGASVLYGRTDAPRSLRTRMNVHMLENRYGDAGDNGRFSMTDVQKSLFENRGLAAELLLPGLKTACEQSPDDLARACEVLAAYDGSLNLDSPGAVLFREWLTRYEYAETLGDGSLFGEAFAASDPVDTPRTLGDRARAMEELARAVEVLDEADLPLDATLRDAQFAWRAGEAIPIHGGIRREGVANMQMVGNPSDSPISGIQATTIGDSRFLTDAGYPVIHGSSFILTLAFDDKGPVAEALLSYSQSGNPHSPHFADQTLLYSDKQWRPVAFHEADVAAATTSIRRLQSGN